MKKFLALLLCLCMILGLAACGGNNDQSNSTPDTPKQDTPAPDESNKTPDPEPAAQEDTIVIMAPPVTGDYAELLAGWITDFQKDYPHLKVEVINTSWDDHSSKLSTMALAGEAPDIAEVSYGAIGTYVEMGVALDVKPYLPDGALDDYDQNALDYMTLNNTLYNHNPRREMLTYDKLSRIDFAIGFKRFLKSDIIKNRTDIRLQLVIKKF